MGRQLTLREALASGRLAEFVRQAEARGVELSPGSDLERALASPSPLSATSGHAPSA